MAKKSIREAQEYLTVNNNRKRSQIVNIELLSQRHPVKLVLSFLQELFEDHKKILQGLLLVDKTDAKVNETIATMFRIHMAMKTLSRREGPSRGEERR
jgi:hypothetical protein